MSPANCTCEACGGKLYFSERLWRPQYLCRVCAIRAGVTRLCDEYAWSQVRAHAATKEPWWQWTVWLYWAIAWDQRVPAAFAESLV